MLPPRNWSVTYAWVIVATWTMMAWIPVAHAQTTPLTDHQINTTTAEMGLLAQASTPADQEEVSDQETVQPAYYKTLIGVMDKLFSELESIQKNKRYSLEEKKRKALEFIWAVRWGPEKKDYFWVHDLQGKMLMDPYIPDLVGKDLSNLRDQNGKLIFQESISICRDHGQGFINFMWPRYEQKKPAYKTALVRLHPEFQVIVGTGIYIDLVEAYEVDQVFNVLVPVGDPTEDQPASPT